MVKKNDGLGLSPNISRRDFVNGTLVGFGAALLSSKASLSGRSDHVNVSYHQDGKVKKIKAKPVVMTFYVPFNNPGYSTEEQGSIGRAELLSKSYRDYEKEIIEQMRKMFSANGFKAERDVAGIVLNRWGHAYISPQPGFHFGKDGKDAPKDIVKKGFGRIQFGHSELSGYMSHTRALKEGARAASAAMKQI